MSAIMRLIKEQRQRSTVIWNMLAKIYSILTGYRKKVHGSNNIVAVKGAILSNTKIKVFGNDNRIYIHPGTIVRQSKIFIRGDGCIIELGRRCKYKGVLYCLNDKSAITIGDNTTVEGAEISAVEGKHISLGNDCMLSAEIVVRSGDSHSVVEKNTGQRVNQSKNITIGNHVWLGLRVIVLKGTSIGDGAIIGAGSIATGEIPEMAVAAGNPARVIRTGVTWERECLPA